MIKLSVIYNKDKEDAIKIYKELLKYLKTKKKFIFCTFSIYSF